MADNPPKPQPAAPAPAAEPKPDGPHVAHLKFRRQELVQKMERINALPETRDHDHDDALRRCRDGIAEIDRELRSAK